MVDLWAATRPMVYWVSFRPVSSSGFRVSILGLQVPVKPSLGIRVWVYESASANHALPVQRDPMWTRWHSRLLPFAQLSLLDVLSVPFFVSIHHPSFECLLLEHHEFPGKFSWERDIV